jgi:short-subunit dehydrogenase
MPNVLITGCSSGIGRALADAFKSAGFNVWASARRPEDVTALAAAGFNAVELDVNAGYGAMGPLLDGGTEAMQRQFQTNVFSLVGVTQALFPALRRSKGLVVNIGSVSGVLVTPFAGAYCASKAAVHALSDALRMELAPFGVRVMEVQPGAIDTSFAKNAGAQAELLINEKSPWWPLREGIRARSQASQDKPTPASVFAADVLKAVQQPQPPRLLRSGNGSRALPLMAALLPKGLLETVLKKRFGLGGVL